MGLATTYTEAKESLEDRLRRYIHNKERREMIRDTLKKADNLPETEKNLGRVIKRCEEFGYKEDLKKVAEVCNRYGFFEQTLSLYGLNLNGLNPLRKKHLKDSKAVYEIGIQAVKQGKHDVALEAFKHADISETELKPEFYKTLSLLILADGHFSSEEVNKEYCNSRDVVKSIDVENGGNSRKVTIDYGDGIVFTYHKQDITLKTQRNAVEFYTASNPFEDGESILKFYEDGSDAMKEVIFLNVLKGLDVPALISSEDFGNYKLNQLSRIEGEPFAEAVKNLSKERKKVLFEQAIEINGKMYDRVKEKEDFVLEELAKYGLDVTLTEQYCNEKFLDVIRNLHKLGINDLADKLNECYGRITDELVGNARAIVHFDYRPRNIILNHKLTILDHEIYKRAHPIFGCVSLIYNPENGFDEGMREELKQKSISNLAEYGIAPEESEHLWLPSVVFWKAIKVRNKLPHMIAGTATEEEIEKADYHMKDMRKAMEEMRE